MAEPEIQAENLGPRVSVIVVAYNQAPALRRAMQALEQSKDRERFEIIVVDCGSQDESSRMDAEFPSINLLRLPHHLGATRAMNIATRTAKTDLLFYLSPNVEVEGPTVAALADALDADAGVVAVCPLLVDGEGHSVSRARKLPDREALAAACRGQALPSSEPDLSQESIAVEYPSLDALMIRKVFVRGMNYFDQRFGHYWADADLAIQARRASKIIRLLTGIRAKYHKATDPLDGDSTLRCDLVSGASELVGKYEGFMGGLMFRLGAAFGALGRGDLGQFSGVLSGKKLDGSQAG